MIETVELTYALFLRPAGRVSFRRWRWELWHGPRLLAAGWRFSPLDAQRALRLHALRFAHRLHGLHLLRPELAATPDAAWAAGSALAIRHGDLNVRLTPRAVENEAYAAPARASGARPAAARVARSTSA